MNHMAPFTRPMAVHVAFPRLVLAHTTVAGRMQVSRRSGGTPARHPLLNLAPARPSYSPQSPR